MILEELRQYIVNNWSNYLAFTKKNCESYHESMTLENHDDHNKDPDYQKYILGIVSERPEYWKGKKALDFGCGCGRNIKNLLSLAEFERVDGCDISKKNADYAQKYVSQFFSPERCKTWETDGYTLSTDVENEYNLVMSHIVFQHISNWSMRYSILADMYKVLKPGGNLNIHFMDLQGAATYHQNYPPSAVSVFEFLEQQKENGFDAFDWTGKPLTLDEKTEYFKKTFGEKEWKPINCGIKDPNHIAKDLYDIGFRSVEISTVVDPYSKENSYYAGALK